MDIPTKFSAESTISVRYIRYLPVVHLTSSHTGKNLLKVHPRHFFLCRPSLWNTDFIHWIQEIYTYTR